MREKREKERVTQDRLNQMQILNFEVKLFRRLKILQNDMPQQLGMIATWFKMLIIPDTALYNMFQDKDHPWGVRLCN